MRKLVTNKFLCLSIIALTIFSCINKKNKIWNGEGIIDYSGEFKTKSMYLIKVDNDDDVISFTVSNEENEVIIKSTKGISNIHTWYLYWDDKSQVLWVYSGDIGSSVWFKQDSIFKETTMTYENQNKLPFKIPKEIEKDILE
ncbi:MAG: hypothetical protein ABI426_06040 [Flavobacterium sp.]